MRSLNKDYGNKRPLFHQKNHQNRYYQPIDTKAKTFLTCTPIASDGYAHTCTPIASDVGRKVPPRSKWRRFRESPHMSVRPILPCLQALQANEAITIKTGHVCFD